MRIRRSVNISNGSVFHLVLVTMAALVRQVLSEDCGQEELVQCTRPLQVLSATSELSFVTKKEELDKLCPDLHTGLHCIRSYTRRCMNIHQRDHFNKLYHGTNEVIHELCEEGPYQEDFLRHAPCMRHVKKDYEVCAARYQSTMAKIGQSVAATTTTTVASSVYPTMATHPAAVLSSGSGQYHSGDMSQHQHQHHHRQQHEHPARSHPNSTKSIEDAEEERLKTVCCAFQKYMQCSEFTVRHACGDETALFTRKFLDKMSNTLMRMHCVDYTPESGKCRDYFSSSATRSGLVWWSSSNMVTLTIVTVLAVVNARLMQLYPGQWLGTLI
uniref:Protein TsetseEP domain-containing protein n=1 Tax=Anopheles funestus TaxID=62324 RepID=A0A4Y0BIS7_ANOFN